MTVQLLIGDAIEMLKTLPDSSVQMCCTSPPYFGLRDYGVAGQIGLEPRPDEYVARLVEVFREVRRVLRGDGVLWLNLGDSYANDGKWGGHTGGKHAAELHVSPIGRNKRYTGLKPKELIGIPWSVARALRDPYYTGRIKQERDRAWIAAMMDGEGTICGFHHMRADDGSPRTGAHITITNSNVPLLDEMHRIWPTSRSEHQRAGAGHLGKRTTYRWIVHGAENKLLFLREVYPYLIAKKRQALVAFNLLLMCANAKSVGHSAGRDAAREKRAFLAALLSDLNQCRPVDVPSWLVEPPSVLEQGWYLRQDVIWAKPNPMPESVRDRCTNAHEYVFMLSKSERYYYDKDAIAEPGKNPDDDLRRLSQASSGHKTAPTETVNGLRPRTDKQRGHWRRHAGFNERWDAMPKEEQFSGMRNRRSVWQIATEPYPEAHFATFPRQLPRLCILAGSKAGDTILDPFNGSGTTGQVALELGRQYIGIELNADYVALTNKRLAGVTPGLPLLEAA